ncbi:pyruvate dehydrogenase complex E1 component subunit beta [Profundibacterium mesophilum]|uniref:Pyruvate dehydrogenase E1 component subunit beta n=1 Tax=Profundibacterium mesophilum KAUST100406-0324 TaxID=1037889 RepID=A0A921TEL4_9RHOB|nr:pyruvate dehydrogenase complex E1 component subunit beta [Profundibacterium mesophilum]KAF0677427.1 pyruvate dehydrogenase E1 component subunit beta [Profundibacterium mesophilum KAUST100406-0324]
MSVAAKTGAGLVQITVPDLPGGAAEAVLERWHVGPGDQVTPEDVVAEVTVGRIRIEIEAGHSGLVEHLLAQAKGAVIAPGAPIAVIAARGEPDARREMSPLRAAAAPCPDLAEPPRPFRSPAAGAAPPPEPDETARVSMRDALRGALVAEMRADDSVLVLGENAAEQGGAYKVLQGLADMFGPRRVVDTPRLLQGVAGLAIGAAFAGLRPVVELRSFSLALQMIEQIVHSAAKTHYVTAGALHCPVVFRGPTGLAARSGAQHSQDVAALFARIPGLSVVQPSDAGDAGGLLRAAIRAPGPVIFLEHELLYGSDAPAPAQDAPLPRIGAARLLREGKDVTIAAIGLGVRHALDAAHALEADGISAEVIDLRSLRPLDSASVIQSVRKTGRCVTVEEGNPVGSIGDHLAGILMREAFDWLDAPVISCTNADVPMPYAANLEQLAQVGVTDVIAAARAVAYR